MREEQKCVENTKTSKKINKQSIIQCIVKDKELHKAIKATLLVTMISLWGMYNHSITGDKWALAIGETAAITATVPLILSMIILGVDIENYIKSNK